MTPSTVKRLGFALTTLVICGLVVLGLGELLVRFVAPVSSLSPRYAYSREYGIALFPSTTMVHTRPGYYRYVYSVDASGFRAPPFEEDSDAPVVLCLGDSFTFGQGVNDGEEWVACLRDRLGDTARVANRGVPGWGIGQQIRMYEAFRAEHDVDVVVLQYCGNDPTDGLYTRVTSIEDGHFVFHDDSNSAHGIKKRLSRSWVQRSQLYNFFRQRVFTMWKQRSIRSATPEAIPEAPDASHGPLPGEVEYIELLDAFVQRIHADGAQLVVTTATRNMGPYEQVRERVRELDADGSLDFVDPFRFIPEGSAWRSPEGHSGPAANQIVARELALAVRACLPRRAAN